MEFRGEYFYLSNAYQYPVELEVGGEMHRFACAEAAFQACRMPSRAKDFENLTSKEAKELGKKGKKAEVLANWNDIRLDEMNRVLYAKFKAPTLRMKLLSLYGRIDMDNQYRDTFWGLYNGRGQNLLGKALMHTRDTIKEELGMKVQREPSVVSYKTQNGGVVAFDTETTGTSANYDDILQITIVGQDGSVLLDTYIKPENSKAWAEAEAVNHITPEMVSKAPSRDKVAKVVKEIFDKADAIVGYNVGFDIKMTASCLGYDFDRREEEIKHDKRYKDKWETNVKNKKAEIVDLLRECKTLEEDGVLKKNYPDEIKNNPLYDKLKKELSNYNKRMESIYHRKKDLPILEEKKHKSITEFTNEEIDEFALKYADSIYVYDVLKDWRDLDKSNGISRPSHKLVDAMWEYCPDKAGQFETEAHDAAADTIATLEVAKVLYNQINRDLPLGESPWLHTLFGLNSGIVCHQVNSCGIITQGFTKRLFQQFPDLRKAFKDQYNKMLETNVNQFGHIHLANIFNDLDVAFIYSEHSKNETEWINTHNGELTDENILVSRIKAVCEKYPEKPVYLPVIIRENGIIDGIGCGKAGAKWEDLESRFTELKLKNLFYVDTTTGEVQKTYDPVLEVQMQENLLSEVFTEESIDKNVNPNLNTAEVVTIDKNVFNTVFEDDDLEIG